MQAMLLARHEALLRRLVQAKLRRSRRGWMVFFDVRLSGFQIPKHIRI